VTGFVAVAALGLLVLVIVVGIVADSIEHDRRRAVRASRRRLLAELDRHELDR